jgi:hypothetical protein
MKALSKNEFSYVVSTITGFTDQVGGEVLSKALIGATTARHATVRLGIKGTQALNLLDSSPSFQEGVCGWSPSGTTSWTQRDITTCPEKLNESLCPIALYDTYQSMMLQPGMLEESVPMEQLIGDLKSKQIQQRVENKFWTATVAGGDCFDGFKTLIASGETGVAVSVSGTSFNPAIAYGTNGNPIFEVDKLVNALDDNAQEMDDLVVFCSVSNFRKYVQSLTAANYFQNYIGSTQSISSTVDSYAIHPNTNVKVIPTLGLNGSNAVTIGPAKYMFVGFDLLTNEKLDMWYSRDNQEIRLAANYNYGVQIAKFGSTAYFAVNGLS